MLVTVLTPTYNRATQLARLFESLQAQSFRDFEWLVIDDGSSDETAATITRLKAEARFDVQYVRQENSGKHIALNNGVQRAAGELTAMIDSDDWYEVNALERLVAEWNLIGNPGAYADVEALCADATGNLIGDRFPCEVRCDSDAFELAYYHRVRGDRVGMHRTSVLREFPFPDRFHGTHVSEAVIWFRIADHFRTRCINEVLGRKEYLSGGMSDERPSDRLRQAGPRREFFQQLAETARPMPRRERLKAYANWSRNALLDGRSLRSEMADARNSLAFAALVPLGLALSERDRRRVRRAGRADDASPQAGPD